MIARRAVFCVAFLASVVAAVLLLSTGARQGVGHEGDDLPHQKRASIDNAVVLYVQFGKARTDQTPWEGQVSVHPGKVASVSIDSAAQKSTIEGAKFNVLASLPKGGNKKAAKKKGENNFIAARLKIVLDAKPTATVKIEVEQGDISFALADIPMGEKKQFLKGEVTVERKELSVPLTGGETEDDFPATAKDADGNVWLAYVEYTPGADLVMDRVKDGNYDLLVPKSNGDRVRLMKFDGNNWSDPMDVTDEKLDIWRCAIAVDGNGVVNVVWSQKEDDDWNLYARQYYPSKKGKAAWSKRRKLTDNDGSDFQVVATTDSNGKVWLAWQSWRKDNYDIVLASLEDDGDLGETTIVSSSPKNDWTPSIAADKSGNVYVVWDTYDKGNYDVLMHVAGPAAGKHTVADSPRFEGRACVTCDADGRVWVAYEEGDEQWGKDFSTATEYKKIGFEDNPGFALYINRTVKLKCRTGGAWKETEADLQKAMAELLPRGRSVPRLALDGRGGLWLALRHALNENGNGEAWQSYAMRYDGRAFSKPQVLTGSANLMDNRPAFVTTDDGVLTVYSGDDRTRTQDRGQDDLFMTLIRAEQAATSPELRDASPPPKAELKSVHPDEAASIARVRDYRLKLGGETMQIYRGDFHRHTEFSAHRDGDGLLEDSLRYAHDAADHDWMGNGDHDNGLGHEYMWWLIQKTFDIHTHTPTFLGLMSYERSCSYPNGHRNVIMPKRGVRPLPRGDLKSGDEETGTPDTKMLYAYLKHFGGMCASHTSGTGMGTDWRDNDPTVEPVVEIYQGHRHNYEHFGAPRSATAQTQIGGYQPAGFIWNALEKGYRLGFESSSDHISTHISYAHVLAPELSRQAIIDAFKARHSYAATDNIILVVRSGKQLMGDEFTTSEQPTLSIEAHGTAPIAKLHVVRDNKYVYTVEPNQQDVKRSWTDTDTPAGKTSYYYVRIEQADGNLAWASPMWITYKP
ncbi:MAG TPA: hypothetical protein VHV77_16365 [Pirellulales bacterium]|nr:hypothetical protein [Pirellulales bacterium]